MDLRVIRTVQITLDHTESKLHRECMAAAADSPDLADVYRIHAQVYLDTVRGADLDEFSE